MDCYVKSRSVTDKNGLELIIDSMRHFGLKVQQSNCQRSMAAYNRYVDLMRIRFGTQAVFQLRYLDEQLPPLVAGGLPGISIVTCAMNRTENLLRALPSWLKFSNIDEIIIVDWSSKYPVELSLKENDFTDPRINVVRVDGEPRWILSYAFNIGFRCASREKILKVDADIMLMDDFFEKNSMPSQDNFVAGDHRLAKQGQEHINGFIFATRDSLALVGGYNEYITKYGWDDDDLYNRLIKAGYRRDNVLPDTLYHIPHSDAQRTGLIITKENPTIRERILSSPRYLIHCNRKMCDMMPSWTGNMSQVPMYIKNRSGKTLTLIRSKIEHAVIPVEISEKASRATLRELLSWDYGSRVWGLSEDALDAVLALKVPLLTKLDIEVALVDHNRLQDVSGKYLVLIPEKKVLEILSSSKIKAIAHGLSTLLQFAKRSGLTCILFCPDAALLSTVQSQSKEILWVSREDILESLSEISWDDILNGNIQANSSMALSAELLSGLAVAPALIVPKRKFYIDAQHGLGNRLRAIGSAAAIAKAADMELVIVWEPDHHCDCQFTDLFDYNGPLIKRSFISDARAQGLAVYNYMPIEEGAEKDAPILVGDKDDVYTRSAFVLKSRYSSWATENQFLQELAPVEAVQQLVASVPPRYDVAVHVRMEAGQGRDHNSYDQPDNWREDDHRLIHEWRAKSHYLRFIEKIDALKNKGKIETLFLAADIPEIYDEFIRYYRGCLSFLPRKIYDRSTEQMHYALADAILLSKAPLLLGSTWSSFTELAERLSLRNQVVEMSGIDF